MSERRATVLEIRTSPHIVGGSSVDTIMFNVVLALVPVTAFAVWAFGWTALLTLTVAVGTCVGVEHVASRAGGERTSVGDWSAAITGLLYGLTLPPHLPLWMTAIGGAVTMVLGKLLFGGLGHNPFNPALVGRAFLQAAFPVAMTQWIPPFAAERFGSIPRSTVAFPFAQPVYDAVTTATPLARWKFEHQPSPAYDLALGLVSGSTGETCAVLILLGGAYLVLRNMMRVGGGMPEGVMYAILLGNVAAPHLDRLIRPRVYGTTAPAEKRR